MLNRGVQVAAIVGNGLVWSVESGVPVPDQMSARWKALGDLCFCCLQQEFQFFKGKLVLGGKTHSFLGIGQDRVGFSYKLKFNLPHQMVTVSQSFVVIKFFSIFH